MTSVTLEESIFLLIPSLLRYSKELGKNVQALEKQELNVLQSFHMTGKVIHPILHHSSKPSQYTANYASQLTSLWKFSDIHYEKLNFMKVQIAMLQCESMLAIAAAWTWLHRHPLLCPWLPQGYHQAKRSYGLALPPC
ncbi:hypothetical protein FKP32DRAFT_1674095 [Trametes sanguinea]|nr:hypothetical protein FKP32DRAFT_1674095 [Trametes sanguinea]